MNEHASAGRLGLASPRFDEVAAKASGVARHVDRQGLVRMWMWIVPGVTVIVFGPCYIRGNARPLRRKTNYRFELSTHY